MKGSKVIIFIVIGICLFMIPKMNGQVKVSEILQKSKSSISEPNTLYFVDFWATWCAPCIHAKKYLGVLQSQFPNNLYIISLSEENPATVENFLKTQPTKLAVAIDYNGENFNKYNVRGLPDGILFNSTGDQLWRGHPADLKPELIKWFLKQEQKQNNLEDFIEIIKENEKESEDYIPKSNLEIKPLDFKVKELVINETDNYLKLKGTLKDLVGYLSKIYTGQIKIAKGTDISYEVYFKKSSCVNENLTAKLLEKLDLNLRQNEIEGEGILLKLEDPKFWDTYQINWGNENNKYLISDSDIKADNISLKELTFHLASVLKTPIIIENEDDRSHKIHDWEIHYKYFELMKSNLTDLYGILIKKQILNYPIYSIERDS